MTYDRRLSDLEDAILAQESADEQADPLYNFEDFGAADDPVKLMQMFRVMEGRWHLLEPREASALDGMSKKSLRLVFEAGWIDFSKVSDGDLDLLAKGRSPEEVLGPEWQIEYRWTP